MFASQLDYPGQVLQTISWVKATNTHIHTLYAGAR